MKAFICSDGWIRRFERIKLWFINMVNKVYLVKIVIAVLKAESIDYLNLIKNSSDCYLYNLDCSFIWCRSLSDIISKTRYYIEKERRKMKGLEKY